MKSSFLRNASILIVGECIKTVFPEIMKKYSEGMVVLTSCPQAEGCCGIVEKVSMILKCSRPKEIIVLTVDGSPHCYMLHSSVDGAVYVTGVKTKIRHLVVVNGEVKEISSESIRLSRYLHLVEDTIGKVSDVLERLNRISLEQQAKEDASPSSHLNQ